MRSHEAHTWFLSSWALATCSSLLGFFMFFLVPFHLHSGLHQIWVTYIDILPNNPSTNPWVCLPQSGFNGVFLQFCSSCFVPTIHISHTSLWGRILTGQVTCYEDRRKNWRARWRLHFWGAASRIYISPAAQSDLRFKKWGCRAILQCLCNAYVTYIYIII